MCVCMWLGVYASVYPQAMSFEAHSLTVPSVMWLGLLPSDLQRFGLSIRYFLLPPPASNWDYILGKFRLFVLVSVAVAITFFPPLHGALCKNILSFKYTPPWTNLGRKKIFWHTLNCSLFGYSFFLFSSFFTWLNLHITSFLGVCLKKGNETFFRDNIHELKSLIYMFLNLNFIF